MQGKFYNMTVNDKALNKMIDKIKKHYKLDTIEKCDIWMTKLFMNMPLKDLENRIDVMYNKWNIESCFTDTRRHILEIAKLCLTERKKNIKY